MVHITCLKNTIYRLAKYCMYKKIRHPISFRCCSAHERRVYLDAKKCKSYSFCRATQAQMGTDKCKRPMERIETKIRQAPAKGLRVRL